MNTIPHRPPARVLAAALAVSAGAGSLRAQPAASKYLQTRNPHDYTLNFHIDVRLMKVWDPNYKINRRAEVPMDFESAAIVFPVLPNTASSTPGPKSHVTGKVYWDERVAAEDFKIISDAKYGGTSLAKWELGESEGKRMELDVDISRRCYETVFDEPLAMQVGWPTGPWPKEVEGALLPQNWVAMGPDENGTFDLYDMEPVAKLVDKWTGGKDPRSVKPVALAKWLAGKVVEHVQPSGTSRTTGPEGDFEGIALQGAPLTARSRRGTEADVVCLLAAAYRHAGLPARIVIGWDTGQNDDEFLSRKGKEEFRFWVEFALFDESDRSITWVPVDANEIREKSSRLPPDFMEQPQEYFGTHDDLDRIVPISFDFHPPTTVRAYGSPAFWGWLVMPEPPGNVVQGFRIRAQTTAKDGTEDGTPPVRRGRN